MLKSSTLTKSYQPGTAVLTLLSLAEMAAVKKVSYLFTHGLHLSADSFKLFQKNAKTAFYKNVCHSL